MRQIAMTESDYIKFDLMDIKRNLPEAILNQPLSIDNDGESYTIIEALNNALLYFKEEEVKRG